MNHVPVQCSHDIWEHRALRPGLRMSGMPPVFILQLRPVLWMFAVKKHRVTPTQCILKARTHGTGLAGGGPTRCLQQGCLEILRVACPVFVPQCPRHNEIVSKPHSQPCDTNGYAHSVLFIKCHSLLRHEGCYPGAICLDDRI